MIIKPRKCIYTLKKEVNTEHENLRGTRRDALDAKAIENGEENWKKLVEDYKSPRPICNDFVILARAYEKHLISGRAKIEELGLVALGSKKTDGLRIIEKIRGPFDVRILFLDESQKVRWYGTYQGYVNTEEETLGRHPSGLKYRPKSTHDKKVENKGYWTNFIHISSIEKLDEPIEVHNLWNYAETKTYLPKYASVSFGLHRISKKGVEHLLID